MMGGIPKFTQINYAVCLYCANQVREWRGGGESLDRACLFEKREDRTYPPLVDAVEEKGCGKFKSSGMPAHPSVLEVLVMKNPACNSIPSDADATLTSWNIEKEAEKYLPEAQILKVSDSPIGYKIC